ncbi:hypothetical protein BY458DRAFT_326180 [Sporodiniella umbellata]|nr:hypothetical protein BY458DRAFT_326180 [Sporodiniella umbellata]
MSAAIKPNEPSSATQKFFRKLHLNAKNTTTRAELVQQQQQLKPKKNVKDTKVQERHKKAKKLSTLLSNRRQEHGITSPPISPTPNHKQGQPRRTSEVNSPQSPKRTGSPAVMSDTVQNQILQEQLEKLATEQRAETCLPSPPVTPAALMTPESETEPKAADVVRPRRLRPAASFAALRPGNHSPHLAHYISRAQPMSYIDAGGDYMIVKKSCFEEPLKRVHRQRIHKRLSEHDLSPSNHHHLPDFIDERFFYQMHHDTSSDSSQSEYKTIRRVDSAKSIASASEHKYESLRNALEKEKAVVRALQKQKEACNRDIAFLSRTNEELLTENQELKKKLEYEKIMKERFQDDLSSTMDKLSEATEHIR